ncbi:MAG: transcription antitermination factor NusB [Gammaproteobacteria bacterium]|nr:transcription antitermination factor NusB [Gammaproteobacteria bacterium]NNC67215.1 transcription antitermination factor NusB [Gammaproteobacteria bacterium]
MEPQKRHWSRRLALQALYQWHISGHEIDELLAQYVEDENWDKADKDYFVDLITGSINQNKELTAVFSQHLNLASEQIDPIENSILLYATYEILHKPETPTKVVLSEAINLCKKFGSIEGYKFINGVLDKVAQQRV